jgi:hypothetical protein
LPCERPEEIGGLAACGASVTGNRYADGRVRNIKIVAGELGSASVSFLWDGHDGPDAPAHVFYLIVDGEARGTIRPGTLNVTEPLGGGGHEINILPARATDGNPPDIVGNLCGSRVLLTWLQVSDADVRQYNIYWDSGTGTVDPVTPLASVTQYEFAKKSLSTPDTGTGTGRVSIIGIYAGDPRNETLTLEITASGATRNWSIKSGSTALSSGEVLEGVAQELLPGLTVRWHDPVSDYDSGDVYNVNVGIRTRYITTEELAAGTYKFKVAAVDEAGNIGDLSSEVSVPVDPPPAAVESPAMTWDANTGEITFTWTDASDTATVHIYTNYHTGFQELRDYVMEDGPLATVSAGVETHSFAPVSRGTFCAYIRAMDSSGDRESNATLLTVEALDVPVALIDAPVIEKVTVASGSKVTAHYNQSRYNGTPAALHFYVSTSTDWADATLAETVIPDFGISDYPVKRGTWTSPDGYAEGTVYVGAIAEDSNGNLTAEGELFGPIATDETAPGAVTITGGITI